MGENGNKLGEICHGVCRKSAVDMFKFSVSFYSVGDVSGDSGGRSICCGISNIISGSSNCESGSESTVVQGKQQ
ncbi:Hypothetical predicted protein [Octopus vulgaris]|uniref:Uncharacterized protein n=1 Tax=Octopus vulgaris TaxID=6645 RepID=A0AA36AWC2_OCTVU|nr:Hypothetical predicted protein [Octopus vulgaris]